MAIYKEKVAGEKYATPNADTSDSHEAFDNCTRLIEKDEVIIDIDNGITVPEVIEMLKFLNITTQIVQTTRGVHIYFKKPPYFRTKANGVCSFGIECEYKTLQNTPNGINVKSDGILRNHFFEGEFAELPEELKCLKGVNGYDLYGYDDGDGRNNALFKHHKHILHLGNKNSLVHYINSNIFATPLDDEEVGNILKNETGTGILDLFDRINFLITKYESVRYDGRLYMKIDDKYSCDSFLIKKQFLLHFSDMRMQEIEEIYRQMLIRSPEKTGMEFPIMIKNGYIHKGEFHPYIYDGFTPFSLDIKYNENAPAHDYVDILLDTITDGDPDYRKLLLQVMAYPLILDLDFKTELGKFFFFVGNGKNGKGTVLKLLQSIYGQENSSSVKVHELSDRTKVVALKNKLVNLGDDIENQPLKDDLVARLKNISTADGMATREMYKDTENNTVIFATMIFTSNHILTSFEKGFSYKRRVVWLPMYNKPKKVIKDFGRKIKSEEAKEYLFRLMVEAMGELYNNYELHECEAVSKFIDRYHTENDNIVIYLEELPESMYLNVKPKAVYEDYCNWCEEEGLKPIPQTVFKKRLGEVKDVQVMPKNIDGKTTRVFTKIGSE